VADQAEAFGMIMEAKEKNEDVKRRTVDLSLDILPRLNNELEDIKGQSNAAIQYVQETLDLVRSADETGHFEESQNIHRLGDHARNQLELVAAALQAMQEAVTAAVNSIGEADNCSDGIAENLDALVTKLA
jgi:hypothetical protein